MANPNKVKGTSWETEVVDFLNDFGKEMGIKGTAERTGSASLDLSDIHMGDWVIEAKNQQAIDLPGYLKQLAKSVAKNGTALWKSAVFVKNRRHSTGDGYAVMAIKDYAELMGYVDELEQVVLTIYKSVGRGER